MKFGFVIPFGTPTEMVSLGLEADAAGWDGFFLPDAPWGWDPWSMLAVIATQTTSVRLGTMITPVSRRRPWKLAGELLTLDYLSSGRAVLPVGLGALDTGFAQFGEATERTTRAEKLDEGLAIIDGLWRGQPFNFEGKHYQVQELHFFPPPPPVQQPRIPIWVVAAWPKPRSMRRALRWDGVIAGKMDEQGNHAQMTPNDVREMKAWIDERRPAGTPFDVVMDSELPGDDPEQAMATVLPFEEAGITWWIDSVWMAADGIAAARNRLQGGPPRVT